MKLGPVAKGIVVALGVIAVTSFSACGGVTGTYSNEIMKVELKSGSKAAVSMMNQTKDCTYAVDQKKVTVTCKELDPLVLTLSDDGTALNPPADSMMPPLKKQK
jgi:hypothetical protein